MHNGYVDELSRVRRDLVFAVDESLYPEITGTADTEILFYLALTFGLEDDPPEALARTLGLVEQVGRAKGSKFPFQGTIATTNGDKMWCFRYSSEGNSRTLFFNENIATLRELYPEREVLFEVSEDSRLVVSEPIGDLPGAWHEVPESSYGIVGGGEDSMHSFKVKPPVTAVAVGA
jgi:glutamine amidotransferase